MTHPSDPVARMTSRGHDVLTGAARTWADSVQRLTATRGPVPDLAAVVDGVYDFAEHILTAQRALAHSMVRAFTAVADATADAATAGTRALAEAAVTGTVAAADAARSAGLSAMDAAAAGTRARTRRPFTAGHPATDNRFVKARAAAMHGT